MTVAVVTWPEAAIWIAVIVAVTDIAIALVLKGYGAHVEFRDPETPTYKWEKKS